MVLTNEIKYLIFPLAIELNPHKPWFSFKKGGHVTSGGSDR